MSLSVRIIRIFLGVLTLLVGLDSFADPAPFDLVGPTLVGTVTRGETSLPITQVPAFAAGDKILLKAQLPAEQSAEYLMVAAFLRGPTNPPPDDWFIRCKTWRRSCIKDGLTLTVPKDAQQLLVFFAPATGGDFKTLKSAVQGRPGAFVRAAQQLNQAALDRSRLDRYVEDIRELEAADPTTLKQTAPVLARSLAIKVDEKCLDRIPALQVPCLTQGHESLILNDGRETSMVASLTSGPASDLAMQAGSTAKFESGAYLPYIGSVFDIARLMDSFHTAHYQYIPALISRRAEQMVLLLNTPPSFHEPQSVLVAALPAVETSPPPTLRAMDSNKAYCAYRSSLALPVEGAPLVFSTEYMHDLTLELTAKARNSVSLPSYADPKQGGFVVDTTALSNTDIDESHAATLSGYWGFDKFDGPSFKLVTDQAHPWQLSPGDDAALVVGRDDTIHLQSGNASCVADIRMKDAASVETTLSWKATGNNAVELDLPLQQAAPGAITLLITQYGAAAPQSIVLNTFVDAGRLERFTLYAGDVMGVLQGSRLDRVVGLKFKGFEFTPGTLSTNSGSDLLTMAAVDSQGVAALKWADAARATVRLQDGRELSLPVTIEAPRPKGALISKSIKLAATNGGNTIQLATDDELPIDATLTFSIRTIMPLKLSNDEQVEVATSEDSQSVILAVSNGAMTLESSKVAVLSIHPSNAFGPSAFGPLRFRLVEHGVAGDWQPLATLVRLPTLNDLVCPAASDSSCVLQGRQLFLLDSVASDLKFESAVQIPEGFSASSLVVPHPSDGRLFVKLRDNPSTIDTIIVSQTTLPEGSQDTRPVESSSEERHSPATTANVVGADATSETSR